MAKTNTKTNNLPNHKKGYVAIYRSIKEHWVYEEDRKRTRFEAWFDLLLMASHADNKEAIGHDLIKIDRGQILTSQEKLAEQWKWDRKTVRSFLNMLMKDGMINIKVTTKFTLVTIAQYASYQVDTQHTPHQLPHQMDINVPINGTSNGHQLDTYNNENNENKKSIVPPSVEEVISFFEEKGFKKEAAEKAHSYYAANNWKDSKNKQVKNWKQKMIAVWFKDENKIPQQPTAAKGMVW